MLRYDNLARFQFTVTREQTRNRGGDLLYSPVCSHKHNDYDTHRKSQGSNGYERFSRRLMGAETRESFVSCLHPVINARVNPIGTGFVCRVSPPAGTLLRVDHRPKPSLPPRPPAHSGCGKLVITMRMHARCVYMRSPSPQFTRSDGVRRKTGLVPKGLWLLETG